MAFEDPEARPRSRPISLHPAFPAIIALWFAVLLGLGSLVLPGSLLDRVVVATGLASVIPAAGPPLGFTARAAIALAAALCGAALGLVIARRVAATQAGASARASKAALGSKGPINIHEELGGEGLIDRPAPPLSGRRALLIADDDQPGPLPHVVPLPGEDAYPSATSFKADPDPLSDGGTLELSDLAEDPAAPADPLDEPAGAPEPEPALFAAPSLSRPQPQSAEEGEPRMGFASRIESEFGYERLADEQAPAARADWAQSPPEDLGLVQLVQRLGSAIEKRREWIAQGRNAPASATAPLTDVDAAPAEEAALAMAAYFQAAPGDAQAEEALPDADQVASALADDAPEGAPSPDHAYAPALRPAFLRGLVAAPEEEEEEGDEDSANGERFHSLLAMRSTGANEKKFVRMDHDEPAIDTAPDDIAVDAQRLFDPPPEEPAVGPSATPQPGSETDAALRAALATLQRMSGTA